MSHNQNVNIDFWGYFFVGNMSFRLSQSSLSETNFSLEKANSKLEKSNCSLFSPVEERLAVTEHEGSRRWN